MDREMFSQWYHSIPRKENLDGVDPSTSCQREMFDSLSDDTEWQNHVTFARK